MNGNGGRIVVLLVALLAIGILVLPSTVSLFAGQHYWYPLDDEGNDVPCQKCHADVFEELDNSDFHIGWGDPEKADEADCGACHRSDPSITYANGTGPAATPGDEAHAASVVACMLCHQYDQSTGDGWDGHGIYTPYAGGFSNMSSTGSPYNYTHPGSTSNGSMAAHNAFVKQSIGSGPLQDSNEACVACHTHVAVKINFTHARSLEFDAIVDTSSYEDEATEHDWVVNNWQVNGTANVTVYGNTTGEWAGTYYPDDSSVWQGHVPGVNYTYPEE